MSYWVNYFLYYFNQKNPCMCTMRHYKIKEGNGGQWKQAQYPDSEDSQTRNNSPNQWRPVYDVTVKQLRPGLWF